MSFEDYQGEFIRMAGDSDRDLNKQVFETHKTGGMLYGSFRLVPADDLQKLEHLCRAIIANRSKD